MPIDFSRATRESLNEFVRTASTVDLMTEMQALDDGAAGTDLTGLRGAFYDGASRVVLEDLGKIRDLARRGSTEDGTPFGRGTSDRKWQARSADHDRAMRVVDASVRSGELPAYAAERVESLLTVGLPQSRSIAARWAVAAGDPAYGSAFAKMAADPQRGHLLWTPEEGAAYRRAAGVQGEMRAWSSTDSAGGFMVPLTLDPAIILNNDGRTNPLRKLARVVQTATESWTGVTSAGVSAEWIAEATEVAEVTPTLAAPNIPVLKGDAFTQYSFEVGMDAVDLLGQLKMVLSDAADQLMATAYTTGPGTTTPKGIVTALAGTASEINSTGSEALVSTDAYALQNALGARWQPRAQWMAHLATINTLRQFETGAGALKFPDLQGSSPSLLGRAMNENSGMDGTINVAATASNYALIYGDFSQFVIVDRIGSSVEFIPNMLGANRRPTGQRGALLWFRTGSDVVNVGAFRMLDIPTTA